MSSGLSGGPAQSVIQHQRPARVGDACPSGGGPHSHAHLVPAVLVADGLDGAGDQRVRYLLGEDGRQP